MRQVDESLRKGLGAALLFRSGKVGKCEEYGANYPLSDNADLAVARAMGYATVQFINAHLWEIKLIDTGSRIAVKKKVGHRQHEGCDGWLEAIPLSNYDHLEVTGIVEEGAYATVYFSAYYTLTPAGKATMTLVQANNSFDQGLLKISLGSDIFGPPKDSYASQGTARLIKYDNGWRLVPPVPMK